MPAGDAVAGIAHQAFAFTHAELNQAMTQNLEKLRTVLRETEQIASRMEELLAQQARPGWQQGGGQGTQDGNRPRQGQAAAAAPERSPRRS